MNFSTFHDAAPASHKTGQTHIIARPKAGLPRAQSRHAPGYRFGKVVGRHPQLENDDQVTAGDRIEVVAINGQEPHQR